MTIKVVHLPASPDEEAAAILELPGDGGDEHPHLLNLLQELVEGRLEYVAVKPLDGLSSDPAHMYCNEEGKLEGRRPNPVASAIAVTHPNDYIAGDVVVLGTTRGGDEADVPQWVVDHLVGMGVL